MVYYVELGLKTCTVSKDFKENFTFDHPLSPTFKNTNNLNVIKNKDFQRYSFYCSFGPTKRKKFKNWKAFLDWFESVYDINFLTELM